MDCPLGLYEFDNLLYYSDTLRILADTRNPKMIIVYNIRGLNKTGKVREISFCLNQLKPDMAILVETRVKASNADKIRNKLGIYWSYMDNYSHHENGNLIQKQDEIEKETLNFYGDFMGKTSDKLIGVDITAIRQGNMVSMKQKKNLKRPIHEPEILKSLKCIGNIKAPGIDGFGSKFFKDTWSIIEHDLVVAIFEFFEKSTIHKAVNTTLITLIPKHPTAQNIIDFRPITCCSIVYKIIDKILTDRLGKVLPYIISMIQTTFEPG
ncbi:uncharacterized protein LOC131651471 [Vicia villosa]|uniref:uncharacterized protein LOC131651471 n=1 Tax=Vicia villosa TaxID=3911 RepID=UPI00273AD6B3|nr:uncharacterized protein LOC131651471 [Vicia villosa]